MAQPLIYVLRSLGFQTGVGAFDKTRDEVTHKAYYQWVPFVLFLQGCMFYMPHLISKSWEGGKGGTRHI